MFGVDRFDAILPPATVSLAYMIIIVVTYLYTTFFTSILKFLMTIFLFFLTFYLKGAIMAVGGSRPTVVASSDGLIGIKNQMQVLNMGNCV